MAQSMSLIQAVVGPSVDPGRGRGTRWLWIRLVVGVEGEGEHHFLPTPSSMSVASAVDLVIIHALVVGRLARMAQFHLLDPFYDESHRGRLLSEGQDLATLRSRTHNGFLDMVFDDRYTNYLRRAGLDVISYQLRRGLPTIDSAAITALVDRYC
ncbi:uncharacterized protein [Zea mays]|uniref:uncharacterized protein n=1 Tax=Zea mays TaxID=4577 RepID=UPI0009AA124A|nr:uncharacterized protein LOC103643937 [Zea mays]|eukprot:XP_020407806.1 uncharacterized protein LOC103643937 [Zea mays]